MGLFTPKISPREAEYVRTKMVQLQDTVRLVNTTTKPDVFFKRLNFALDILLDLQSYERYGIFKGSTPTNDYNKIIRNMEATVNDFIDRALAENRKKIASLKTESAKQNNRDKFASSLIAAFDHANTFWSGSFSSTRVFPHYTGPLYTANNYRRVQNILYETRNQPAYCSKCGTKLSGQANFCTQCGAKVQNIVHTK